MHAWDPLQCRSCEGPWCASALWLRITHVTERDGQGMHSSVVYSAVTHRRQPSNKRKIPKPPQQQQPYNERTTHAHTHTHTHTHHNATTTTTDMPFPSPAPTPRRGHEQQLTPSLHPRPKEPDARHAESACWSPGRHGPAARSRSAHWIRRLCSLAMSTASYLSSRWYCMDGVGDMI